MTRDLGILLRGGTDAYGQSEAVSMLTGPYLLFSKTAGNGTQEIYRSRLDGTGPVQLTDNSDYHFWWPKQSPGAERMLFVGTQSNMATASTFDQDYTKTSLWTANIDGTNVARLIQRGGYMGTPNWMPNGRQIVYFGGADATLIRLIRDDGTLGTVRTVADGATNTNTTVTSATMAFVAGDVGKSLAGGTIPDGARILVVVSATEVRISAAASGTATGVTLTLDPNIVPVAGVASGITDVCPNRTGDKIAFAYNYNIYIVPIANGYPAQVTTDGVAPATCPTYYDPTYDWDNRTIHMLVKTATTPSLGTWVVKSIREDGLAASLTSIITDANISSKPSIGNDGYTYIHRLVYGTDTVFNLARVRTDGTGSVERLTSGTVNHNYPEAFVPRMMPASPALSLEESPDLPAITGIGQSIAATTTSEALVNSVATVLSTRRMHVVQINLLAGMTVRYIAFLSGSVGITTPTHWWFGLYDINKNRLGVTADQTTGAWSTNTWKGLALTTPYTIPYTGRYYLTICMECTTPMNFTGPSSSGSGLGAAGILTPIKVGSADTLASPALPTDAPATLGTITSPTAGTIACVPYALVA